MAAVGRPLLTKTVRRRNGFRFAYLVQLRLEKLYDYKDYKDFPASAMVAEWIRDRRPPMDLVDIEVQRMNPFQGTRQYLKDRTTETLGLLYKTHWPFYQYTTARGARRTHLYDKFKEEGAVYGELVGWERPECGHLI